MKKILGFVFITFLFSLNADAQPQDKEDRIKSIRIAFITSKLDMTPEEAQAFWPIYNNYEKERKELKKKFNPPNDWADLTDQELEDLMEKQFELDEAKLALRKKYFGQFKEVLPIKKIARLHGLEKEFKKHLVERIGKRRNRK